MSAVSSIELDHDRGISNQNRKEFLTILVAGQRFGIPILQVQDVLGEQVVTHVPLAPKEVAGAMNLRGRIVTAIDVRCCLGIEPREAGDKEMSVVVENEHELYSLVIDTVGDVLNLEDDSFESNPTTLDETWRDISLGIYRLEGGLLVILDVPRLLNTVGR